MEIPQGSRPTKHDTRNWFWREERFIDKDKELNELRQEITNVRENKPLCHQTPQNQQRVNVRRGKRAENTGCIKLKHTVVT